MTIIAAAVISADGRLTRHDEIGTSFASRADQQHFRAFLRRCDAWIMGRGTYEAVRDRIVRSVAREADAGSAPLRVVLTRDPARFLPDEREGRLEFTADAPRAIVASLAARGCSTVGIVGGAAIYGLFQEAGLIDEWLLSVEPAFFGTGLALFDRELNVDLKLAETRLLGSETLLLHYRVRR